MFKKPFDKIISQNLERKRTKLYQAYLKTEAKAGGYLFGQVPRGIQREFYCLDEQNWVWRERWLDMDGQVQVHTTEYLIKQDGIFKSENKADYQRVSKDEAESLYDAAKAYEQTIGQEIYNFV